MHPKLSEVWENTTLVFVLGILLSAPLFYLMGRSVSMQECDRDLSKLQEKYYLTNKALEAEIQRAKNLEARAIYLEMTLNNLSNVLSTIYTAASQVKTTEDVNGLEITAQAIYIVDPEFCIDLWLKNRSDRQKTALLDVVGQGIDVEEQKTTVYAGEEKRVEVCGSISDVASSAKITVDGKEVLATVIVLR